MVFDFYFKKQNVEFTTEKNTLSTTRTTFLAMGDEPTR